MACQNCGDEYSSVLSETGSEGVSLDGLDRSKILNLQANQNARRINISPGIFNIDFRPIFWECTAFLLMKRKRCWLSTSKPDWVIFDLELSFPLLSSAISKWYFVFRQMEAL